MRQPDVQTVAVSRVDGGVTILRVVETEYLPDGSVHKTYEITPAYVDSLIAKYVADGHWTGPLAPVSWRFVPNDFVDEHTDRDFRNAWADTGKGKPGHDMAKAQTIHRDRLRALRGPKLAALDTEVMRADEENNKEAKAAAVAKKQKLRDLPDNPRIAAAKTIDELKALTFEELAK